MKFRFTFIDSMSMAQSLKALKHKIDTGAPYSELARHMNSAGLLVQGLTIRNSIIYNALKMTRSEYEALNDSEQSERANTARGGQQQDSDCESAGEFDEVVLNL